MNKPITNTKIRINQAKQLDKILDINNKQLHKTRTFFYNDGDQLFTIHNN